ncbi:MAG TPA: ABC transporter ATP-binding protein [Devosia sp.]|jgi:putative ABC transport system ATP-binding protein|nr:ABC transporter ATP-binding protein [Devosia sp.]
MNSPIVTLRNVTRAFAGGVLALRDVSLEIGRGELIAVVGPSGSGKSTMLNIIGTLDRASTGKVEIGGFDVATLKDSELSALRARRIGFVFQHFHLSPGVSALDNVADGLLYTGVTLRDRRERAAAALQQVGLGHRLDHRPHQLSGGEKQRTAIARALVRRPLLLLADEPTGALDSASGEAVVQLLLGLHREGTAVVVITHDRDLAARFDRQASMRDGRLVGERKRGES